MTRPGLDAAIARLAPPGRREDLPVAIETTSGLVVDRLLAAVHPVVPIHPNASTRRDPAGTPAAPSPTQMTATSSTGDRLRRLEALEVICRDREHTLSPAGQGFWSSPPNPRPG
jgi:hypothetical protein